MMDNNYDILRFAIIWQAVKDYESALRKRDEGECITLERWFLSDWGQLLSCYTGEQIIKKCKVRVATKPKERVKRNVF